jgi:hypothetical protein
MDHACMEIRDSGSAWADDAWYKVLRLSCFVNVPFVVGGPACQANKKKMLFCLAT